jgi:hypothetical protein
VDVDDDADGVKEDIVSVPVRDEGGEIDIGVVYFEMSHDHVWLPLQKGHPAHQRNLKHPCHSIVHPLPSL